ncbi:MAG: hypothetical protein HMLKMBBP_02490 [Planctomycetes bacterium]|nr:hypothetical protein [Planctomycetota bacterium]
MRCARPGLAVALAGTAAAVVASALAADPREILYHPPQVIDLPAVLQSGPASSGAPGDVNGDGRADFLLTDGYGLFRLLGDASGLIETTSVRASGMSYPISVITGVADVDGDGDVDIVGPASLRGIAFLLNDGTGAFPGRYASPEDLTEGTSGGPFLLDLGTDGDLDAVVAATTFQVGGKDGLRVFELTAAGLVKRGLIESVGEPCIGDFNGDGRDDLVVVERDGFLPCMQSVAGELVPGARVAVTGLLPSGAAIDLDRDGDLDVVVPPGVIRNDGNGNLTFDDTADNPLPYGRKPLVDFDTDGLPDIAAGTGILRNLDGSFAAAAWDVGVSPATPLLGRFVADVDGSGLPDLIQLHQRTLVVRRQAGGPPPTSLEVAPQVIRRAGPLMLEIAGENLAEGASIDLGAGVAASPVTLSGDGARCSIVVEPGVGGGVREAVLVNPDSQSARTFLEFQSVDPAVFSGRLFDSSGPARDVLRLRGAIVRNDLSPNGDFSGRRDGFDLRVGGGDDALALAAAPGDPRWIERRGGRVLMLLSAPGEFPRFRLTVDLRRDRFELEMDFFDYPQVPRSAEIRWTSGADYGASDRAQWRPRGNGQRLRIEQRPL